MIGPTCFDHAAKRLGPGGLTMARRSLTPRPGPAPQGSLTTLATVAPA
jgi:hypothetical protein